MSLRTNLATTMLTGKLPSADVAAEMLNAAHLEQPVKMQTPPNPAKCQQIIKGPFVKAATLAHSTDDPATLEKLARHSALGVKVAVVENPAASDAARRIVEAAALKRSDDEMLTAVIKHAGVRFLIEALNDPARHDRYARILHDAPSHLTARLSNEESPVTSTEVEDILRSSPERFAALIGSIVGARKAPGSLRALAGICATSGPKTEVRFLNNFASSSPCVDDFVVDALERLRTVAPESVPVGTSNLRADLRATSMTDTGRSYLLQLGQATATVAYAIDPSIATISEIAERYGDDIALHVATWTRTHVPVDVEVKRWMLSRMHVRTGDGIQMTCDGNHIESILDVVADDEMLVAALKKAPTHLTTRYLSGQFGDVSERQARLVVPGAVEDILRNLRHIEPKPWAGAVLDEVVRVARLRDIFSSFHICVPHLLPEHIEILLGRVGLETDDASGQRWRARIASDSLSSAEFLDHIDRTELSTVKLLALIRNARKTELTLQFLNGERNRKMSDAEIDELLADPGEAFGGGLLDAVLRRIEELQEGLDIAMVDRVVDAAGPEAVAAVGRVHAPKFVEYLLERIGRCTESSDEWITAFELLTKSSVPVGTALSGAKRLNKARNR